MSGRPGINDDKKRPVMVWLHGGGFAAGSGHDTLMLDGRPQAFDCAEWAFVFYNSDRCATMTGGGADARAPAGKVADASKQFVRTGDPNHKGIPNWPKFTPETAPTMMFDSVVNRVLDPDALELESIA